jgi:hypothetical protein
VALPIAKQRRAELLIEYTREELANSIEVVRTLLANKHVKLANGDQVLIKAVSVCC